jgi:hypothetical protein
MSSKSINGFSHLKDNAEHDIYIPPKPYYAENNEILTVREVIQVLQKLVQEDPTLLDEHVYHAEFGGIERSDMVEVDKERRIFICKRN